MSSEQTRKLSCRRCQTRKLKCSRKQPCVSCVSAQQKCEFRKDDTKRRPISQDYVESLENRVASLESFIKKLKDAPSEERDVMLNEVLFHDHLMACSDEDKKKEAHTQSHLVHLQVDIEGSLIYHGPTSIFSRNGTIEAARAILHPTCKPSWDFSNVGEHFGIQEQSVDSGLRNFFRWQYPHFVFIYREAFLRDHHSVDRENRKYWSLSLLYAICALGSCMAESSPNTDDGERFFGAAESILMVSGLNRPCITTVQAFLCLAFYQVGRGNLSKGWAFSGIAFRMSQDLGIHCDPRLWIAEDTSLTNPEDLEIRRRIYWGCFASDKIISFMLGRSPCLFEDDATVEPTERLPDFPEMSPWLSEGVQPRSSNEDGATDPGIVGAFQKLIELTRIMHNLLIKLRPGGDRQSFADGSAGSASILDALNLDLCRWQETLPGGLKWNKWEPSTKPLLPHVAALHVLFNSVRACLNIGFVPAESDTNSTRILTSSTENIIALVRKYKNQHGLRHVPLVFVYGIIQAAYAMTCGGGKASPTPEHAPELEMLLQALDKCSATWPLALQAKEKFIQARALESTAHIHPLH